MNSTKCSTIKYAVTFAPGYFSDVTRIVSTHATLERAIAKAKKSRYLDERKTEHYPLCVVEAAPMDYKGATIYAACYPAIAWRATTI